MNLLKYLCSHRSVSKNIHFPTIHYIILYHYWFYLIQRPMYLFKFIVHSPSREWNPLKKRVHKQQNIRSLVENIWYLVKKFVWLKRNKFYGGPDEKQFSDILTISMIIYETLYQPENTRCSIAPKAAHPKPTLFPRPFFLSIRFGTAIEFKILT